MLALTAILLAPLSPAAGSGAAVAVKVSDPAPYHAHTPGRASSVTVRHNYYGESIVQARWKGFGSFQGNPIRITGGQRIQLDLPGGEPGYYGLIVDSDDSDIVFDANPRREYGFVVLPPKPVFERLLKPDSPFGLVHADIDDPYLHPGYVKTLVVPTGAWQYWSSQISERRRRGLIEVPLQSSAAWRGDPGSPVSSAVLAARAREMQLAFTADPATLFWELGLEENLWSGSSGPYYWSNLAATFEAVHQAASGVNPDMRLLYQIEGFDYGFFRAFFNGPAPAQVDILALHPYRWPDFPSPETWLEDHVRVVQGMAAAKGGKRLWITELGAPVQPDSDPRAFFGYPATGVAVKGHTRDQNAVFMVKAHVLALASGIEKIFWYNYRDRGPDPRSAEDNFGLVDYWGYPKPAYAAYAHMIDRLDGKTFRRRLQLSGGVLAFEFSSAGETCFVLWTWPESRQRVPVGSLGLIPAQLTGFTNTVGTPATIPAVDFPVEGSPAYLTARLVQTAAATGVPRRGN